MEVEKLDRKFEHELTYLSVVGRRRSDMRVQRRSPDLRRRGAGGGARVQQRERGRHLRRAYDDGDREENVNPAFVRAAPKPAAKKPAAKKPAKRARKK